ncbi:MauE/DoxX family redox-associated membrane protein [Fictibacillus sp. NPDC058756]|uniref:MauE/DoxX family redox-associated membrane protein n=1 Tax=Fictibacillus sp. NPDC058756 TaxID=3346625 RepID=UPI0036C31BA5
MTQAYDIILLFIFTTFLISAIPKLINLKYFITLVHSYEVLPRFIGTIYGVLLPFIELGGTLLLLSKTYYIYGSLFLLFVLLSFTIAVTFVIRAKRDIKCGCYGKFLDSKVDSFTIIKIIILVISNLFIISNAQGYSDMNLTNLLLGLFFTITLLLLQKIWSTYRVAVEQLKLSE